MSVLKRSFVYLSILIAMLVGIAAVLPEWRVSPRNLRWLLERALPKGFVLDYANSELLVLRKKGDFLAREVEFKASRICVGDVRQKACFEDLSVKARLGWSMESKEIWKPRLLALGPVRALGGEVDLDFQGGSEAGRTGALNPDSFLNFDWSGSRVDIRSIRVRSASGKTYRARFRLMPESSDTVRAKLIDLRGSGTAYRASLDLGLRIPKGTARVTAFEGSLDLKTEFDGAVRAIILRNCRVIFEPARGNGELACERDRGRIELSPGGPTTSLAERRFFVLKPRFRLHLKRLELGGRRSADFRFEFSLDYLRTVAVSASLEGHFIQQRGHPLEYKITGGAEAEAKSFRQIVRLFANTPLSVPAPFNILEGRMNIHSEFAVDPDRISFVYHATTSLDGGGQSIHLSLTGNAGAPVKRRRRVQIDSSLSIQRLWLTAPRLEVAKPPRLLPDRRFGSLALNDEPRAAVAPAEPPFDLRLRVLTAGERAVLINSNLTSAAVPIALDLLYEQFAHHERAVTGTLVIGRTPINIFGRDSVLHSLRIERVPVEAGREGTKFAERIDGTAQVNYLEYDIMIRLLGTVQHPVVRLSSTPPLSDEQIVAVLLFGRPIEELSGDKRGSVANMKAAFADAALGLTSLYLLSRTPVTSVGYNAERGLVTANISLGGGAAFEFGAGRAGTSDAGALGFRKRLGPHLLFRTDLEELGESGRRVMSALIEWSRRF